MVFVEEEFFVMFTKNSVMLISVLSLGIFTSLPAEEYVSDYTTPSTKRSGSGLELRANFLASSGRFVQEFTESDPSGHTVSTDSDTSDLTSRGLSLLVGYGRDYIHRDQSSFLYIGYENQKWSDDFESVYHAFLMGAEGGIGSRLVKFIYGGEFAFGSLDTGVDGMGYLYTFSAEPFVGLRLLSSSGLSLNFRFGVRGMFIEDVITQNAGNSMTSENSAFTANAGIGVGYSFY